MADLDYQQKYANYRLDFPDFQTVQRHTFAKGTVVEVKKTQDDPITMAPLVKVTVQGGSESDFIPLFFTPKLGYWNNRHYPSQEFDQGGGYFQNAWQSFRADDDVIVMLEKNIPKRVIAFAGGIPKEGEDIFKFKHPDGIKYWSAGFAGDWGRETGPDGIKLNLVKKYGVVSKELPDLDKYRPIFYEEGKTKNEVRNVDEVDYKDPYFGQDAWCGYRLLSGEIWYVSYKPVYKVFHNVMVIGPIIYAVEVYERSFTNEIETSYWIAGVSATTGWWWGGQINGCNTFVPFPERPGEFWAEVDVWTSKSTPGKTSSQVSRVLAAPYTKELLNQELNSSLIPNELIHQKQEWEISQGDYSACVLASYGKDYTDSDIDLKVVPHEK